MSAPVDVLAVMERDAVQAVQYRVIKGENSFSLATESDDARAAIAELIGALKDARAALDNVGLIDTYIDFDAVQAASDRADAALATVSPK